MEAERQKGECMSKDEEEAIKSLRKLTPENRANVLSNIAVTLAAEEGIKKHYGIEDNAPEGRKTA